MCLFIDVCKFVSMYICINVNLIQFTFVSIYLASLYLCIMYGFYYQCNFVSLYLCYQCIFVSMYLGINVSLCQCTLVSMYLCVIVPLYQFTCMYFCINVPLCQCTFINLSKVTAFYYLPRNISV